MPSHSHAHKHAHSHPPASGGLVRDALGPSGSDLPDGTARRISQRPVPAVSLLMHGVALRLLGATGIAVLLWLAVAWAIKGPA